MTNGTVSVPAVELESGSFPMDDVSGGYPWREGWASVWFYADDFCEKPIRVLDAGGLIEPEVWVREHGIELFPWAIYFFPSDV